MYCDAERFEYSAMSHSRLTRVHTDVRSLETNILSMSD